jgi:hypothetical protein
MRPTQPAAQPDSVAVAAKEIFQTLMLFCLPKRLAQPCHSQRSPVCSERGAREEAAALSLRFDLGRLPRE